MPDYDAAYYKALSETRELTEEEDAAWWRAQFREHPEVLEILMNDAEASNGSS